MDRKLEDWTPNLVREKMIEEADNFFIEQIKTPNLRRMQRTGTRQ